MLILTRNVGETVVVGTNIFCTILGVDGNGQTKIAFDAPKSIPINRFEIHSDILQKIKANNVDKRELNWDETVLERLSSRQ